MISSGILLQSCMAALRSAAVTSPNTLFELFGTICGGSGDAVFTCLSQFRESDLQLKL